jgi:hypothetical protein
MYVRWDVRRATCGRYAQATRFSCLVQKSLSDVHSTRGARRLGVAEMPLPCKEGARASQTRKSTPRLYHNFTPPHTPRISCAGKNTRSEHLESTFDSKNNTKVSIKMLLDEDPAAVRMLSSPSFTTYILTCTAHIAMHRQLQVPWRSRLAPTHLRLPLYALSIPLPEPPVPPGHAF